MARMYMPSPIPPFHSADGTALNTSITLTDISPAPQKVPAWAVELEVGMEIEINAWGEFSNTATPTLILGLYWGGVAGVALAASTAVTTTTGATAWPWSIYYRGQIRALGTAGSIKGSGQLQLPTSLTATSVRWIPETAAARTVAVDTTPGGGKALTVGAQWGTSSASNTITCYGMSIIVVN
jgi:hypothetical protein